METINFMDPKKRHRQTVMLLVGYVLVACMIIMLTLILLIVSIGYGYKNGHVIQSGLLFVSSNPRPAQIYINGVRYQDTTNTRLLLPAGTYNFDLRRAGYRDWQRSVDVVGLQVSSYTYPLLLPTTLTTTTAHDYESAPALISESPDQRWLLVSRPATLTSFDVYDLNNPKKASSQVDIPASLLSAGAAQSLQTVAWAGDNTHVLLTHMFDGKIEYILLNRSDPVSSVNLTKTLVLPASGISVKFDDQRYDHYLVLNAATGLLSRASLSQTPLVPYMPNVLNYDTSGSNMLLYAAPDESDQTKVDINMYDGTNTYRVRQVPNKTTYLLALAQYQGDMYAAVSASSENTAFLYEDPITQINNKQLGVAVPIRVFTIKAPDMVQFAPGGQYVVFENGTHFAVYDAENQQRYIYSVPDALDAPQAHASWMDGARLQYVSHGQLVIFDYDGLNRQTVVSSDPHYLPAYDNNFKTLYTFVPASADKTHVLMTTTSLRTPADQ